MQNNDTALLHIQISRQDDQPFTRHNLKVSFQLPRVDIHGSWDSQASPVEVQHQQMIPVRPFRMGRNDTAENQGMPFKMLLHRSGQNRWASGTVDQIDETRIDIRPDMRTGTYSITVEKLPAPISRPPFGPPMPRSPAESRPRFALQTISYEQYVYLSRTHSIVGRSPSLGLMMTAMEKNGVSILVYRLSVRA